MLVEGDDLAVEATAFTFARCRLKRLDVLLRGSIPTFRPVELDAPRISACPD